jgi:hypothetical protein
VKPCHFDRSGEISSRPFKMNRLYFGDNLRWLSDRKEFPDASVGLVYLDPRLIPTPITTFSFASRAGK